MNQPSLWSAFVCALFIHLLTLGGFSVYATRGINFRMPEVYRVTIVSPQTPATGVNTHTEGHKKTQVSKPSANDSARAEKPLQKGVTLLFFFWPLSFLPFLSF
ncbi:MAG: hypothetical protein D6778_07880 [Nitrospirae bacterium]|nr:MAG: hypothetical protein D6778_07880 [Nitrospirota bacterium]